MTPLEYRALLRGLARQSDAAFAEYVTGEVFPVHLRAAARFADGHDRGLVLMPRGHAKTTLFMARAARRIGLMQGRWRLGILTAVGVDADARSGAIRRMVESPAFAEIFPWAADGVVGTPWTDAQWTVKGVDLGKDHTCVAMGLQSVRAGPRLDELLADDMVGLQENATAGQREKARRTYLSVVDPMVVPGGRRMFLGTRWHEDDIYQFLIRTGWPSLVRGALQDGEALWPSYWPAQRLIAKRLELGSAIFDLQYMNDPSGMGGNIFKRDWFQYVERLPEGVERRAGMDLAAGAKERSDFTSYVEVAEDGDHNLYIVGSFRERLDEGHRAWLTGMTDEGLNRPSVPIEDSTGPKLLWGTDRLPAGFVGLRAVNAGARSLTSLNIESTQHQSTFTREVLAKTRLPAQAVWPDKDKVTRARTLAARYEAGKVFHLRSAPGLDDYERELVGFPNSEHDDIVDAVVYAADLNTVSEFYWGSANR